MKQLLEPTSIEHGCSAAARGMNEVANKLDAWLRRLRPPASIPPCAQPAPQQVAL